MAIDLTFLFSISTWVSSGFIFYFGKKQYYDALLKEDRPYKDWQVWAYCILANIYNFGIVFFEVQGGRFIWHF